MSLTKNEFYVLRGIVMGENAVWGIQNDASPEEEAQALASLQEKGYVQDGKATDAGFEALEPYRARNAIIQAAGFSSRFAPISYDTPKGLIEVKGEILLERQIRQLHAAGVTDITLITGHLAEKFQYLKDKFDIKIIHNPEYPFRNTISTMYRVLDLIGNTYILDSDHYIEPSVFSPYVWESFYPVLQDDTPGEWYMIYDENHYIIDMLQCGHGQRLHGPSYIANDMRDIYVKTLEEDYEREDLLGAYWENALWDARGVLKVACPCERRGRINEFDSMEDLFEYDPTYLDHVYSPCLDNICATLGCERKDIRDCKTLTHDATSSTCSFAVNGKRYVYYHPKGYAGSASDAWSVTPEE